jgi:hypothetical protein
MPFDLIDKLQEIWSKLPEQAQGALEDVIDRLEDLDF